MMLIIPEVELLSCKDVPCIVDLCDVNNKNNLKMWASGYCDGHFN